MPSSPTVDLRKTLAELIGAQRKTADQGVDEVRGKAGSPFDRDAQVRTKELGGRPARASDLFPVAIARADVATAEGAGSALSKLLDRPELGASAKSIAEGLGEAERARFEKSLASFTLIADSALTMLDYDKLGTGWEGWGMGGTNYPENHEGYRRRKYRPDFDKSSQPRRDRSKGELAAAIGEVMNAKDPVAAMESVLASSMIQQLGISEKVSADWKPKTDAIAKALDQDLFIPMRALLDATLHLDHRGGIPMKGYRPQELDRMCREVVEEIAKHVVEGDFEEWRFSHELSRLQLACLTPEQEAAYRAPLTRETWSGSGKKITTRDEQGSGLFWVTKIGGPSHGFDMLSQCLIPLLANARNGAIVVEEEGYPDFAARSVIRLFPLADGKPVLYLEMLQVDFPHEDYGKGAVSRSDLRMAIIEHAVEKAKAMGVPLVIAPSKFEKTEAFAEALGLRHERKELELVLHPSAGVFEASDTLVGAHHAPQTKEETVRIPVPDLGGPHPSLGPPQKPLVIYP